MGKKKSARKCRPANAVPRKMIRMGLAVACRSCKARGHVPPADYHAARARCPSCGGLVDRVHPRGSQGR